MVPGSERISPHPLSDPAKGRVSWRPAKSIWIGSMTVIALIAGPLTFTWAAFALLWNQVFRRA